jgi:hypothetical protein
MSWWMHIDISCSINIDSLTAIDISRSITIYIDR